MEQAPVGVCSERREYFRTCENIRKLVAYVYATLFEINDPTAVER